MPYKYSMIRLAISCLSLASLISCGQQDTAPRADPENVYTEESWYGVAFPDYRDMTTRTLFGPFDVSEQCVAAVNDSGAVSDDTGVFECCIIDEQHEDFPGQPERFRICEHNFSSLAAYDTDRHGAYDRCTNPTDLCNERGQLVRDSVQVNQRNAQIRAKQIESKLQELFSAASDLETKKAASARLIRAYNRSLQNVSGVAIRIYSDSSAKTHSEIEGKLASGRDTATNADERRVFENALTRLNRILIEDILEDINGKISTLIEVKAPATPALGTQTKVDAVLMFDQNNRLQDSNLVFDHMTSAEISNKRKRLSKIGVIHIKKMSEAGVYYTCTTGVGNAYRLKYEMHAVDLSADQVTAYVELLGESPPEKIESYKCEGVGNPPDWSGYFTIAENN